MIGSPPAARDEQLAAIRAVVADTERLQSDPGGFSQLLTQDVVLVNAVGRRVFGRELERA